MVFMSCCFRVSRLWGFRVLGFYGFKVLKI